MAVELLMTCSHSSMMTLDLEYDQICDISISFGVLYYYTNSI